MKRIPFSRWTRETKLFLFASFSLLIVDYYSLPH
nr:MAG TPA: hypothetical protein [Caudoviricetes sp.]